MAQPGEVSQVHDRTVELDRDAVRPSAGGQVRRPGQGHRAVPAPIQFARQQLRAIGREQHVDVGEVERLGAHQRRETALQHDRRDPVRARELTDLDQLRPSRQNALQLRRR